MVLSLKVLNSNVNLNTHFDIDVAKFVRNTPVNIFLKLMQTEIDLRYVPEASSNINLILKKSDNTEVQILGSFPLADDRSIILFELTQQDTEDLIGQNLVVSVDEPTQGLSYAILKNGLQSVLTTGC